MKTTQRGILAIAATPSIIALIGYALSSHGPMNPTGSRNLEPATE